MRLNVICFATGVIWLQQQSELPGRAGLGAIALSVAILLVAALTVCRFKPLRQALWAVAFGIGGFAIAACVAQARLSDTLPAEWEGRDIDLVGVVASLPQDNGRRIRFELDVERVITPHASVPQRIVLSWWHAVGRPDPLAGPGRLRAGERWRLTVRLRRPHGNANPHGFDYEAWLFERALRASGYVRRAPSNRRLEALVQRPRYWIERARELARTRIMSALPEAPYAGVIAALVIGDQRAIPAEQWRVFTRTGVNHLMSISGLHVTMVSGLIFALVFSLWRHSAWVLRVPARKMATLAGLATAFAYALLSGFAVPAQRTLFMLTVVAAALWLGTIESPAIVLAAALFIVLLLDPWAVLAPGFWLSFGAVATIMYVTTRRVGQLRWLPAFGRIQIAVTLALVPLLLAMFQQVSIVSPVANALAIPVVSLVVVPISLIGTIVPFDFVLQLAHATVSGCLFVLNRLSELPAAVWVQHAPRPWTIVLATGAVLLLLAPRGTPGRWLGGLGLLPMLLIGPPPLERGALQIAVLDVGHGVAILIRTSGHALLYDTGPSFGRDSDSGSRIIVPYLRSVGVRRLDGVVVSHDDNDHAGGAVSVLQAVPVAWLMSSLPDGHPLALMPEHSFRCHTGQQWQWDGVHFEILHPTPESYDDSRIKDNDRSCVLRIESEAMRVLLTADIERRSEYELIASHAARLRADILLAPHQGSRTSSEAAFLAAVQPRIVIFPVGYRNRFGHPHRDVLGRYLARGVRVFRTDRDGAVLIESGRSSPPRITAFRSVYRRYWQTPSEQKVVPESRRFLRGRETYP